MSPDVDTHWEGAHGSRAIAPEMTVSFRLQEKLLRKGLEAFRAILRTMQQCGRSSKPLQPMDAGVISKTSVFDPFRSFMTFSANFSFRISNWSSNLSDSVGCRQNLPFARARPTGQYPR